MILLDTHAAIWLTTNDAALGKESRSLAATALAEDRLVISVISFWEIAMLIAKQRLRALDSAAVQRAKILAAGIRELPLTGDVAVAAVELEKLPADPADRFIAATAIAYDAMLMTSDAALLRWRHPVRRQNAAR